MSNEEWRPWRSGEYEVSSLGRVRRAKPAPGATVGRVLRPATTAQGYRVIRASVGGRLTNETIHRMVAESFNGPCPIGCEVNHIDGDKGNNTPANLEYVTHADNMGHAARTGLMLRGDEHPGRILSSAAVRAVRVLLVIGWSPDDIGAAFSVSGATIRRIESGDTWKEAA